MCGAIESRLNHNRHEPVRDELPLTIKKIREWNHKVGLPQKQLKCI
jgi:hypothetical protein